MFCDGIHNEPNQRRGPVSSALVFTEIRYRRKMADEFQGQIFGRTSKSGLPSNGAKI